MFRRTLASALILFAVVGVARSDNPLAWKLNKGDTFYVEEATTMRLTMVIGAEKENVNQRMSIVSKMTVMQRFADGSLVVEQEIVGAKQAEGGQPPVSIDAMNGVKFQMTFDRAMKLTRFDGYEDLVKKITGDNAEAAAEFRKNMPAQEAAARASEPFNLFVRDANDPIGPWTRKRDLTVGPLGKADMTLTFRDAESIHETGRELSRATFTGEVDHRFAVAQGGGFQVTGGKLMFPNTSGTVLFDRAAGRLDRLELSVQMKGDLTFSIGGVEMTGAVDATVGQTIRLHNTRPAN